MALCKPSAARRSLRRLAVLVLLSGCADSLDHAVPSRGTRAQQQDGSRWPGRADAGEPLESPDASATEAERPADAGDQPATSADAASPQKAAPDSELASACWVHPLTGKRYLPIRDSRRFGAARAGERPPECGRGHCGVDLGGERGSAIHAVSSGTVVASDRDETGRAGRYVVLAHGQGRKSYYVHLDVIRADLEPGALVETGEVLGTLGRTGIRHSAPHLHFAVSLQQKGRRVFIDPEPLLHEVAVLPDSPAAARAQGRHIGPCQLPLVETLWALAPEEVLQARLSGIVRDASGFPVRNAKLRILSGPAGEGRRTTTDSYGHFAIGALAEGTYSLRAAAAGLAPRRAEVVTGQWTSLKLAEAAKVEFVLVDRHTRAALPSIMVELSGPNERRRGTTDEQGVVTMDSLKAGRWNVSVRAQGYVPVDESLTLEARRQRVPLEIARGAHLAGTLRDQNGERVARARVWVGPASAQSDDDGRFRISGAPTGAVVLRAQKGPERAALPLDINPGDEFVTLELQLE